MFFLARYLRVRQEFRRTSGTLSYFHILDIAGKPLNNCLLRVRTHKCTQNRFFSFASPKAFQTSRELRPRILDTRTLLLFWSCGSRTYHRTPCPCTQLFPKNNDKGSFKTFLIQCANTCSVAFLDNLFKGRFGCAADWACLGRFAFGDVSADGADIVICRALYYQVAQSSLIEVSMLRLDVSGLREN